MYGAYGHRLKAPTKVSRKFFQHKVISAYSRSSGFNQEAARYTVSMIQIPLTEQEFAAKAMELEQQHGIALTGYEGKLSKMGVTAGYQYADGQLRVTILDKPFFVTTEYCEQQLQNFLGVGTPGTEA